MMTKRLPQKQSVESFVEERIQEAQKAGEFANLPGFGKPIEDLGELEDENWWLKKKLRRERLSALPPGLQIRADVARELARIETLKHERDVRLALKKLNEQIREANRRAVWGPPSTTMPIEVEEFLKTWRSRVAKQDECG